MENTQFLLTSDGSVGLYDEQTKDIYHSVTGALTESFDKFIYSVDFENFCKTHNCVEILDICFGIGYNTKTAIYSAIKNNENIEIRINALEIDRKIAYLSPLIMDGLSAPFINLYLLAYFIYNFEDYLQYISTFLQKESEISSAYFDPDICLVLRRYLSSGYSNYTFEGIFSFLHNIYYQNISDGMKTVLKSSYIEKVKFNISFGDARVTLQELHNKYDYIFLDAFTPHKQPLLWTYDFLSVLKTKMKSHSILTTYSNSAPVRKTLKDLGFYIGKIILNGKQFGTIASMASDKIKNYLTRFDEGLLETKAGIPYRDLNFNLSAKEILKNRDAELNKSNLVSATEYKRKHKNE